MRWHETLIPTLREVPKEADATSHVLMLRAGYIRRLSAGVYSYLPVGLRVLTKICQIIREEMNRAGAEELFLPTLHPAELWMKTGRFQSLGQDKFSFKNRSGQEYVLGPTHEEVITEIMSATVRSYKELPKTLYQIQTKFRDELRPRFGVIRSKEFLMKDAYSFDRDEAGLEESYKKMYEAYCRIFSRCGLRFLAVEADPGLMGGRISHEFMVRCPFGEDWIAECQTCGKTASRTIAARAPRLGKRNAGTLKLMAPFDTPNLKTIAEISENFGFKKEELVKTILYTSNRGPIAALVRGDAEINEAKLRKATDTNTLSQATPEEIEKLTGAPLGFTGPVGLKGIRIVADYDLREMKNFVVGANAKDKHLKNVNLERDFKVDAFADLRYVESGDPCAGCQTELRLTAAMEIGHVFKLGTRYSEPLEALYLDETGKKRPIMMGCYGIGVNRIMAAHIEEHHDEKGITWQKALAPFTIFLMNLNPTNRAAVMVADSLYHKLNDRGLEVLYDDRDERAGVKFHDADLIGIPLQAIVSDRNVGKKKIELRARSRKESFLVDEAKAVDEIGRILNQLP